MAEENVATGSSDLEVLNSDLPAETEPAEDLDKAVQEDEKEIESEDTEEESENIDDELKNFDEEKTEVKDDVVSEVRRPSLKKIMAKYPNIDKEFPDIKHVFYREQEFTKVCGTVEDAKEMSEKAKDRDYFATVIANGQTDVFVKALNDDELGKFAKTFLPALYKRDHPLFIAATRPLLVNIFQRAYKSASDDNMRNSVLNLCGYVFGKRELPVEQEEKIDPKLEAERKRLDQERQQIANEKYEGFHGGVKDFIDNKLISEVLGKLDQKLSDAHKSAIASSVLDDIEEELNSDQLHMSTMSSLWRRAGNDNFKNEWRSKIITAYLGRARQNLDSIIKKYSKTPISKAEPRTTTRVSVPSKELDKKIDVRRTKQVSDLDIINSK